MPIFYATRAVLLLTLAALLIACGQVGSSAPQAQATRDPNGVPAGATMQLVLAASEIVVGPNRFPLGLIVEGTPANDPQLSIQLEFHEVANQPEQVRGVAEAVYRGQGLPVGLYVAEASFERAGDWTVNATVLRDGKKTFLNPMRFTVLPEARTPALGTPAPASQSLTLRDVPDIGQLTSDVKPDPALYELSIAEALAAKKPFLVLFATPGYCQTATCGPNIEVLKQLKKRFGAQVNFIHVEVYPYPFGESFQQGSLVPTMREWKLQTEPWTFLVDAQGLIQAKYEGGITPTELTPVLEGLLT